MWMHLRKNSPWLAREWLWESSTSTWTYVRALNSLSRCFDDIAFGLLPHWDGQIHSNYSKRVRKTWSYAGETSLYGDPGNATYDAVFKVCLRLRRRAGAPSLWYLEYMNEGSIGDIFEAVLGFPQDARLHGEALRIWPSYARALDEATIAVYESFSPDAETLLARLDLDDILAHHQLKAEARRQLSLIHI